MRDQTVIEYFDRFIKLGYSIVADEMATTRSSSYREFLRLGRRDVQDIIAVAESIAEHNYTAINRQMALALYVALAAILVLLLASVFFSHQTVTAMYAARQAAEAADHAKSEFLATMSHEIRTPMSGVVGIAELLARSDLNEKQRTFVSAIVKSGEALTAIINDVLDLSKIDAGKMQVRPHPFDLVMMVEDVATLLAPRAAEKGIELAVRVQPDLPTAYIGDAGHIRQVIINLLGNAIKFTDIGHVLLDISGRSADGHAKLTFKVEDTGIGIPADKRRQIFEQFAQIDNATTRREQGTGLGLAISSKLVALMGGEIDVSSEEGRGSCFRFSLDLPIDPDAPSKHRAPRDLSGASVLVVDDNEINRMVIVEQLKSWDFEAYAVDSAEKGLQALRETVKAGAPFDLAVLDYHMPKMDGLDLAAAIRNDNLVHDVPILMLTSIMEPNDDARFRAARIDGHLTKPARATLLLDTIVSILHGERPPAGRTDGTSGPHDGGLGLPQPWKESA
jgi:signal transduction histidine kinase/ActR/RegA family two-component response regulator